MRRVGRRGQRGAGECLSPTGVRPMEQFQPGEVVRLKSGGPWMIVTTVGTYSGWTMRAADTVSCRWFEGEKPQETVFDVALLEKVSARGARHRVRTTPSVNPSRTH